LIAALFTFTHASQKNFVETRLLEFKATSRYGMVGLTWKTAYEQNLVQFEIELSRDGINFQPVDRVPATNSPTGNTYSFEHKVSYSSDVYYRLRIMDINNHWQYSDAIEVPVENIPKQFVYPSVITTGSISLFVQEPFDWLQVTSMNGTVILKQNLSGKTGRFNIPISSTMAPGVYIVQLKNQKQTLTQKIVIQKS